jgi:hypothetical protein
MAVALFMVAGVADSAEGVSGLSPKYHAALLARPDAVGMSAVARRDSVSQRQI